MSEIPSSISSRNLFWLWHARATLQQKSRAYHDFYRFVTCSEIERIRHVEAVENWEVLQQCKSLRNFSQILRTESEPQLAKSRRLRDKAQKCLSRSQNLKLSREQAKSRQQHQPVISESADHPLRHHAAFNDFSTD